MVFLIALLGGALFSTYAAKLPYVSNQHAAWASFGSLLAGFFTLTSTLATVATLLFLARQNREMQKVTQAQLSAMTFDRYISHRKLFLELLEEQEKSLSNNYRFRDPTLLYNAVFPNNSLYNCELIISPEFDKDGEGVNLLGRLSVKLEKIKRFLSEPDLGGDRCFDFIHDLIALRHDLLLIEQERPLLEGDVLFKDKVQGFNVFMLDAFVCDSVKLANVICVFTKSPGFDVDTFYACSPARKEWIVKELYIPRRTAELTAHSNNQFMRDLVWIRSSLAIVGGVDMAFVNAKHRLDEVLSTIQGVGRIKDKYFLMEVVEACLTDVKSKFDKMSGGEHFQLIGQISMRLHHVKIHL